MLYLLNHALLLAAHALSHVYDVGFPRNNPQAKGIVNFTRGSALVHQEAALMDPQQVECVRLLGHPFTPALEPSLWAGIYLEDADQIRSLVQGLRDPSYPTVKGIRASMYCTFDWIMKDGSEVRWIFHTYDFSNEPVRGPKAFGAVKQWVRYGGLIIPNSSP